MPKGEGHIKWMKMKQRSDSSWGWRDQCGSLSVTESILTGVIAKCVKCPTLCKANPLLQKKLRHSTKIADTWKSINTEFKSHICRWPNGVPGHIHPSLSSSISLAIRFWKYHFCEIAVIERRNGCEMPSVPGTGQTLGSDSQCHSSEMAVMVTHGRPPQHKNILASLSREPPQPPQLLSEPHPFCTCPTPWKHRPKQNIILPWRGGGATLEHSC